MKSQFARQHGRLAMPSIQKHFGIKATYVRGSEQFQVTVRERQQPSQVVTSHDVIVETKNPTFLILADEKPFRGSVKEPKRGDQIWIEDKGTKHVYEAIAAPNTWDWSTSATPEFEIRTVRR